MNKIIPQNPNLNFFSTVFENCFVSDYQDSELLLDLSPVNFIDPFGILFLKIYLHEMLMRGNMITVIFNDYVVNYLVRMNFHKFFENQELIQFQPDLRNITLRRSNLSDTLIELQEFVVQNDDEVESIVEQIVEIVGSRIDYYQQIREGLFLSLSESISNVEVHSQVKKALVILQSYVTSEGNQIVISVGDEGIGIKRGLKYLGEGLSEEDAIEKALEPKITSREGGGGMGLTDIKEYILENNDFLGIRSGSGYLYIKDGSIKKGSCNLNITLGPLLDFF